MRTKLLLVIGLCLVVSVFAGTNEIIRLPKAAFIEKVEDRFAVIQRREFTQAVIPSPTNRVMGRPIRIIVTGQVAGPSHIDIPEGTTVLEAINKAGGFAPQADCRNLRIHRQDAMLRLFLHKVEGTSGQAAQVWSVEAERDPASGKWKAKPDAKEDFKLRDGDVLTVGELTF